MKEITAYIRNLDEQDQAVMATIVKVEGSAYRRKMIFRGGQARAAMEKYIYGSNPFPGK